MNKCPGCGSLTGIREIIYGLPEEPLDEQIYETGGCCISECDPTKICKDCGWEGEFINRVSEIDL
jgi:hypothetical protein